MDVLPRRQGTHTGSLDPLCPVSAFAARLVRRACGYIGTFPGTTGNCRRWKRELPARRAVSRTGSFKGDAGGAEWPNQAGSRAEQCVLICFAQRDRKSTRLNSSHVAISYAVFCLKKKKK